MPLAILARESWPSGRANEDRAGARGGLAWIIDGATDVVEEPLTPGPTDAAWLACELDLAIAERAASYNGSLATLPATLAYAMDGAFRRASVRTPRGPEEYPSATMLALRSNGRTVEYVGVGDCALIALSEGTLHLVGVGEASGGDAWVAEEIRSWRARSPEAEPEAAQRALWPKLRAARQRMNAPGGYGVVSITAPPQEFVRTGSFEFGSEALVLLATDGLMRLVEIFGRYTAHELLIAAADRGLADLLAELRAIEDDDPHALRYPRAKSSDDATGLLLRLTSA